MARANLTNGRGLIPHVYKDSDLVEIEVASAYATDIYPGEPVIGQTDGTVTRTPAGSAAGAATDGITGVVVEILQYKDPAGFVRKNAKRLPASTTWTAHKERSLLLVLLANNDQVYRCVFTAAAASLAAARSLRFGNADHSYAGTADTGLGLTPFQLNIATIATTATLQWRVLNGTVNLIANDPTQALYTGLVVPNLIYALPLVGGATLGVT